MASLQNRLYFPAFQDLPQADDLDANYYAENGQGAANVFPYSFPPAVKTRVNLEWARYCGILTIYITYRTHPSFKNMDIRWGNRERFFVTTTRPWA